ncbi:MAG: DUF4242 domain-containing protein [Chloroflexi bacterium]|nr:DUF4242 domain-containing protein [Chloroflexota bacterium]
MPLLLIETVPASQDAASVRAVIDAIERAVRDGGGEVVEAHVTVGLGRVYVAAEHPAEGGLRTALAGARLRLPPVEVTRVRLVGATLEDVKARRNGATYLVEWDFPTDLTMDRYLERKRANSVHYAAVPEVRFLRTYVREDMEKCLCLYDAPDEDCVRRAREAVSAPVTRLSRIIAP